MRTKKALYNFIFDAAPQILISIIGFFRIKIILDILSDSALGIYQLFGQLLAYVSLAELGLTGAVAFLLYEPIYNKNQVKINQILSGAKYVFNIIAIIMLFIGILITFNLHLFVKETYISFDFMQICFFLMVVSNIITYFVTAHVILFDAEQNKYIYTRITQPILIIKTLLEIVLIYVFKNLMFMIILSVLSSIIQNVIILLLSKRHHPQLLLNQKKDVHFLVKIRDIIPHKIGMLVAYNIDIIILSKFVGLFEVVVYTSYMYIINTISNIIGKISSSTLAGIGDLLIDKSSKSYASFIEYNSFLFFLATIICVPLFVSISPFIGLWYGTRYIVNDITVFLFVFTVFYSIIRICLNVFANAAGLFKETVVCVYIEVFVNLIISLLLVDQLGIKGVLIGTVISYISSEYLIKPFILNRYIFKANISLYYINNLKFMAVFIINILLFWFATKEITYSNLIVWFFINVILFVLNFIITIFCYKILGDLTFLGRLNFHRKVE